MAACSGGGPGSQEGDASPATSVSSVPSSVFTEVLRLAGVDCEEAGFAGDSTAEVGQVSARDLEEIRKMHKPPIVVQRTLEATFLLLNAAKPVSPLAPPAWVHVQRMLNHTGFLARVQAYDSSILRDSPTVVSYVAAKYFATGSVGQASLASPYWSMNKSLSESSLGCKGATRPSSLAPSRRRTVVNSFFMDGSGDASPLKQTAAGSPGIALRRAWGDAAPVRLPPPSVEPLTFQRVSRASKAVGALFRWCTSTLAQALDPSAATAKSKGSRKPPVGALDPRPATPTSTLPRKMLSSVVASQTCDQVATPLALPNVLPGIGDLPQAPVAREPLDAAVPPSAFLLPLLPRQKTPLFKKRSPVQKTLPPDRHFEILIPFEHSTCRVREAGEATLQTVAATVAMRQQLAVVLLSSQQRMESDILGDARMRVVERFLMSHGLSSSRSSSRSRAALGDEWPGVVCQLRLESDAELRDYFLRRAGLLEDEEGRLDLTVHERLRGGETRDVAAWLEEGFTTCGH